MVKIVNEFGDVKIGKQGEVVYQRKHGEQIRRILSPKRAIASEAQIAHRQLYRDALAWRSQLSLPNRRYLDGYCISNGIVDSYHIPLPWSRFALKLYLEAVRFALMTKPIAGVEGGWILQEYYEGDYTGSIKYYAAGWGAQTFTPLVSHDCHKVALMMARGGSHAVYTVTCSIRNTDGAGKPTGGNLVSKVVPFNDIPPAYDWVEFEWDTPISLAEGTTYALVLYMTGGTTSNYIVWRYKDADPYPRGRNWRSSDSGSSWYWNPTLDHLFKEWGYTAPIAGVEGLLHVRHPALLTVKHTRGDLIINGYDTLSSLDEEYLTGQVGLDVEAGDSIKATSLPGIEYNYLVR